MHMHYSASNLTFLSPKSNLIPESNQNNKHASEHEISHINNINKLVANSFPPVIFQFHGGRFVVFF